MADAVHEAGTLASGHMTLVTSDGVELAARSWLLAAGVGGARTIVVLVHGFSAGKDDRNVVALATRLGERGFDVISYDGRGHGDSGGTCTLGDLERLDVAAAVAWARQRSPRTVLVGASMGGVAVLRHAAGRHATHSRDTDAVDAGDGESDGVAGVVVVSSPAEWRMPLRVRALLTGGLTRTTPGRWVSARRLRVRVHPVWTSPEPPRLLAARLTSPLAIVHGHRDRLIPPRAALDLYGDGGDGRRLILVPGMGHAFDTAGHGAICDAVEWVLEQSS
jgi:pimeloyl-ACP methyl ester carboxylesterase